MLLLARALVVTPRAALSGLTELPALLLGAVLFSLIPAVVYGGVMELWFRLVCRGSVSPPNRRLTWGVTLVLSTALGGLAGWTIQLVSEAPVGWIGTITGLVMGVVLIRTGALMSRVEQVRVT